MAAAEVASFVGDQACRTLVWRFQQATPSAMSWLTVAPTATKNDQRSSLNQSPLAEIVRSYRKQGWHQMSRNPDMPGQWLPSSERVRARLATNAHASMGPRSNTGFPTRALGPRRQLSGPPSGKDGVHFYRSHIPALQDPDERLTGRLFPDFKTIADFAVTMAQPFARYAGVSSNCVAGSSCCPSGRVRLEPGSVRI
jgi:hypothetical protein